MLTLDAEASKAFGLFILELCEHYIGGELVGSR